MESHVDDRSCRELFALLSEYIDGELPSATCEEMDQHIRSCAPCIQFVENLKTSIRLTHEFECREKLAGLPPQLKRTLERVYEESLRRKAG